MSTDRQRTPGTGSLTRYPGIGWPKGHPLHGKSWVSFFYSPPAIGTERRRSVTAEAGSPQCVPPEDPTGREPEEKKS